MNKNGRYVVSFLLGGLTAAAVVSLTFRNWLPATRQGDSPDSSELESSVSDRLSREIIANLYLRGEGLEIGALHLPTKVPPTAKVKYVDILPNEELEKQYPELLQDYELVKVDIVDDGEYLRKVKDGTQDFVIANHFLEHCQNPVAAVENMLRVLKRRGILYMAVPDKRFTFDRDRPVTPFSHVMQDYREGPEWSRRSHFEEWVTMVNKVEDRSAIREQVVDLMAMNYSIHYHVWRLVDINEFLIRLKNELGFSFDIELIYRNPSRENEVIFILSKI